MAHAKGDLEVGQSSTVKGNLPVGTDGQVLTLDSAQTLGVKWAAGGGGGGTTLPSFYYPDAPPSSAHANDDEFNDNSIGGAWTEWDYGNKVTLSEGTYGFNIAHLANAGEIWGGAYRTVPAAASWSIMTKIAPVARTGDHFKAGLILFQDATVSSGDFRHYGVNYDNTNPYKAYGSAWSDYQSWAANLIDKGGQYPYLRIRKSGTTYSFDVSIDGLSWVNLLSGTIPFAPAQVGLAVEATSNNAEGASAYFRFWRQTDVATFDAPILGRTI